MKKKKGVIREKYRIVDENGKPTPFTGEKVSCDDPSSKEGIEALKEVLTAATPEAQANRWKRRAIRIIPAFEKNERINKGRDIGRAKGIKTKKDDLAPRNTQIARQAKDLLNYEKISEVKKILSKKVGLSERQIDNILKSEGILPIKK